MPTRAREENGRVAVSPVAVVLAAGKGTRMNSALPKVLHELMGAPLLSYPIGAARAAGVARVVVVVGYGADAVRARLSGEYAGSGEIALEFAVQAEQRGTGHAVLCALPSLADHDGLVFILSGDVPLLRSETLTRLAEACARSSAGLALASFRPSSNVGYGRVLRDAQGAVTGIREQRDATAEEREIRECNAGVYCARASLLRRVLPTLGSDNAQGEIYLTDLVARAGRAGAVAAVEIEDPLEVAGVNTPEQLAALEDVIRRRQ